MSSKRKTPVVAAEYKPMLVKKRATANSKAESSGEASTSSAKVPKSSKAAATKNSKVSNATEINNNEKIPSALKKHFSLILPKGQMEEKLEQAQPYNFFMSTVDASPETHKDPQFITFQEIFDESLGELEWTVQINQNVDFEWLMAQYKVAGIDKLPLIVIYECGQNLTDVKSVYKQNLIQKSKKKHHSKLMILKYTDGSLRIVVMTANLYKDDWENRAQGIWISDKLPHLTPTSPDGESPTGFRKELIEYLEFYKMEELKSKIHFMYRCDFSSVKVFFVTSTRFKRPGNQELNAMDQYYNDEDEGERYQQWQQENPGAGDSSFEYEYEYDNEDGQDDEEGEQDDGNDGVLRSYDEQRHKLDTVLSLTEKITKVFSQNKSKVPDTLPVVIQSSTLKDFGRMNTNQNYDYLRGVAGTFRQGSKATIKVIYPTKQSVEDSHETFEEGAYCPLKYKHHRVNGANPMKNVLHDWKSDSRYCSKAIPNIKSYSCFDSDKLYWFYFTTDSPTKPVFDESKIIVSYETGIIFLPRTLIGADFFPLKAKKANKNAVFKLPFDTDMKPYSAADVPFYTDKHSKKFMAVEEEYYF